MLSVDIACSWGDTRDLETVTFVVPYMLDSTLVYLFNITNFM